MNASFFNADFWSNFASNGLATLLGVIIGIPIAVMINNYVNRKTEKEKKIKILKSLRNELFACNVVIGSVQTKEKVSDSELYLLSSRLRNELWKTFSDGGEIQWINSIELLDTIADSYYLIRCLMELSDRYYNAFLKVSPGAITQEKMVIIKEAQLKAELAYINIKVAIGDIEQELLITQKTLRQRIRSYKENFLALFKRTRIMN